MKSIAFLGLLLACPASAEQIAKVRTITIGEGVPLAKYHGKSIVFRGGSLQDPGAEHPANTDRLKKIRDGQGKFEPGCVLAADTAADARLKPGEQYDVGRTRVSNLPVAGTHVALIVAESPFSYLDCYLGENAHATTENVKAIVGPHFDFSTEPRAVPNSTEVDGAVKKGTIPIDNSKKGKIVDKGQPKNLVKQAPGDGSKPKKRTPGETKSDPR